MDFPDDRLYSEYHIWIKSSSDGAVLGLSDFAGAELGAINYLELPVPGVQIATGAPFGIVETSKAIVELISPVTARVAATNAEVLETPEKALEDSYGRGWLLSIDHIEDTEELMDADTYRGLVLEPVGD